MTNLVLIDCHDLGQHLGTYGCITVPSPNLDALAAAGVRFANSFTTSPQCSPSRAALYTGRYPHANGMFGLAHAPFNWQLKPGETHLARYLQAAGYMTVQIGTQHVTSANEEAVKALGYDHVWQEGRAAAVATRAVDFLTTAPREPFFLNIGFFEPHRDDRGLFKQAPPDHSMGIDLPPYLPRTAAAAAEFADLQGTIGALDAAVGRILAALEERALLDDTWIIFTTDHGLAMPRAKCTLYDAGLETALIMLARPFGLTGGRVIEELVSHVDLVPTILEMLALAQPANLQGRSYAPLLRGTAYTPRDHVFAEKTFHTAYEPQRGVRTKQYKFVWNAEAGIINVPGDIMHSPIFPQMIDEITAERAPFELYDLAVDPLERTNLIGNGRYAEVEEELRQTLAQWMEETDDPLRHGPIASPFFERGLHSLRGDAA